MSHLRIIQNDTSTPVVLQPVLSDLDLLHAITIDLIGEQDSVALYGKIVDAAIAIAGAQFGTMQIHRLDEDKGEGLELLISRGLKPEDEAVWKWVHPGMHSSCTAALKTWKREIIEDFEQWPNIAGTPDLEAFRRAGIRSAQTTPLLSSSGTLLGMISTHWSEPHVPSERDLRMLDILARQAADLLERTIREEALKQTVAELQDAQELQDLLTGELNHRVKNLFAMVYAVTSQTLKGSSDQLRVQTLQQRLLALSSAHTILLNSSWQSALIGDVINASVQGAGMSGRIRISGPDVLIGSKASLNVALIIHELTTNALKHGSLSTGMGLVDATWRLEDTPDGVMLRLTWRESKGPEVVPPTGKGFGSRLISGGLGGSSGVITAFNSTGLVCEISSPLAELQGAE